MRNHKPSSSWENSVVSEGSSLLKWKRQWLILGSWQLISSRREGGKQPTLPMPNILLKGAGRAPGDRDKNSRVQLQQKLQGAEVWGRGHTAGHTTATKARSGTHQQPALVEKPVEKLDETRNKPKPGIAPNHILSFPLGGKGEYSPTCELQSSQLAGSCFSLPCSFLLPHRRHSIWLLAKIILFLYEHM